MERFTDITQLRKYLSNKKSIAFVPTMGNLHDGHLSLVQTAQQHASCAVVSIFVNQLQFSPTEDYEQYPRTPEKDFIRLSNMDVDAVFIPDNNALYPVPQEVTLNLPSMADTLEGEFRPGFFRGVATIVLKLFNIVRPQVAVFGKKDYQQLVIVDKMVQQLNLPIKIIACETIRADNGCALSSRNQYLNNIQQVESSRLYQTLTEVRKSIQEGERKFEYLQNEATKNLSQHGWKVDYIAIQQRDTLAPATKHHKALIVVGAAWLGETRLIDNLEIDLSITKRNTCNAF